MAETVNELNTQLNTVNTAITKLLNSEQLTRLEVGTGINRTVYQFSEINLDNLTNLKDEILKKLAALNSEETKFRRSSAMRTAWSKL